MSICAFSLMYICLCFCLFGFSKIIYVLVFLGGCFLCVCVCVWMHTCVSHSVYICKLKLLDVEKGMWSG